MRGPNALKMHGTLRRTLKTALEIVSEEFAHAAAPLRTADQMGHYRTLPSRSFHTGDQTSELAARLHCVLLRLLARMFSVALTEVEITI